MGTWIEVDLTLQVVYWALKKFDWAVFDARSIGQLQEDNCHLDFEETDDLLGEY